MTFEREESPGTLEKLLSRVRSGRMTRRGFLERSLALGLSSGAALTLLDACGSAPGASGSVTYWNLFGGGDGVRMLEMTDAFSKAYPAINLESVTLAWGEPYYTKIAMAAAGGRPPDIAISHITRMYTYAAANLLEPFDLGELAKVGITEDKFLPATWQRGQFNSKQYAIPLDTHPFVMYYNIDICKKAGLLDSAGNLKPMEGPDAVISAFKAAQQVTGAYGLAIDSQDVTPWRTFYTFYSQLGGQVFSPDSKELVLDDAKAEQVLSFMSDLTVKSKVAPPNSDYGGAVALFGSGKAGFHWNGEWEVTTFTGQSNFHFNMVPIPKLFDTYKVQADLHSFVLPSQALVDPANRAAAYEFLGFMLKDSFTWAQGGHIPAYQPVADSSAYKNLKPQSNYASVADSVVIDPPVWFGGSGSDFETQAGAAFQSVMTGQSTPKQGIQQFRTAINRLLNIPSPL
jgi:multiple sugar transport system substrate-binding protein